MTYICTIMSSGLPLTALVCSVESPFFIFYGGVERDRSRVQSVAAT